MRPWFNYTVIVLFIIYILVYKNISSRQEFRQVINFRVPKLVTLGQIKLILIKLWVQNIPVPNILWVPLTLRNHHGSRESGRQLFSDTRSSRIKSQYPRRGAGTGTAHKKRQSVLVDVQPATRKQVLKCPSPLSATPPRHYLHPTGLGRAPFSTLPSHVELVISVQKHSTHARTCAAVQGSRYRKTSVCSIPRAAVKSWTVNTRQHRLITSTARRIVNLARRCCEAY